MAVFDRRLVCTYVEKKYTTSQHAKKLTMETGNVTSGTHVHAGKIIAANLLEC